MKDKLLLWSLACLLVACQHKPKEQLMVFCAAGLSNVMQELADSFEIHHPSTLVLNLASSGTLARQMAQGMLPDIYIAADQQWADYVSDLGLVDRLNQQVVGTNGLVLICAVNDSLSEADVDSNLHLLPLLGDFRLAMGNPQHVPAGRYAYEALRSAGSYEALADHLLLCKDVRSVLMCVEMQECPLGFVYTTDALLSSKVKILHTVAANTYPQINYVASLCTPEDAAAKAFYDYIASDEMAPVWLKYGFVK